MDIGKITNHLDTYPVVKEAKGWINSEGDYGAAVNTSDILTYLIRQVGKHTKKYASDLFITWRSVEDFLEALPMAFRKSTEKVGTKDFWFGLRDMGVDHHDFVEINPESYYIKLYVLRIEITDDGDVIVKLHDCSVACNSEDDSDNKIVHVTMNMEIEEEFYPELKRFVDHHIEYLIDLDNHPEIISVFGCEIEDF